VLRCSKEQRKRLIALMQNRQAVEVTGSGGTLNNDDRYAWFTVISFKPAANAHP
jgi:hypothetical protein